MGSACMPSANRDRSVLNGAATTTSIRYEACKQVRSIKACIAAGIDHIGRSNKVDKADASPTVPGCAEEANHRSVSSSIWHALDTAGSTANRFHRIGNTPRDTRPHRQRLTLN